LETPQLASGPKEKIYAGSVLLTLSSGNVSIVPQQWSGASLPLGAVSEDRFKENIMDFRPMISTFVLFFVDILSAGPSSRVTGAQGVFRRRTLFGATCP
jgi:hypothetical protein